jgi:hypothetical protein
MTTFSKKYQLQKQSGLTKKQWSALLSHAASAVGCALCEGKENKTGSCEKSDNDGCDP